MGTSRATFSNQPHLDWIKSITAKLTRCFNNARKELGWNYTKKLHLHHLIFSDVRIYSVNLLHWSQWGIRLNHPIITQLSFCKYAKKNFVQDTWNLNFHLFNSSIQWRPRQELFSYFIFWKKHLEINQFFYTIRQNINQVTWRHWSHGWWMIHSNVSNL